MKNLIFILIVSLLVFSCENSQEKPANDISADSQNTSVKVIPADSSNSQESKADENATNSSETGIEVVKEADPNEQPADTKFVGEVISLSSAVLDAKEGISKDKASSLLSKGQLLAFFSNGKVFLVYNTDGTYASKKLAQYAGKKVTITGVLNVVSENQIIIADKFD